MRVVHIIKVTRISGAERHLLLLLTSLIQRGVDARLVILVERDEPMDDMLAEATERGIPITRLIIRRDYDLALLWKLRAVIRGLKPDLVHTHLVHADLFGYFAARAAGVRHVISSRHARDQFRYEPRWRRINRRLWRWSAGGIAISESIRQFAIEVESAPAEKIAVVHYGLDFAWSSDDEIAAARHNLRADLGLDVDSPVLGMVSRLVEQKGVPYALEAMRRLKTRYPRARLVIAGDGGKADELRRLASALGIADRVHWLGWRDDAAELMAAFDLLLVPSLGEGFGLVLLEAMARRVPVIASRVGAIPEVIVHGETGILIEPRDVAALEQAMTRLLDDRALRKYMGLLGAARLEERFSIERMVEGTIAVYERIVN